MKKTLGYFAIAFCGATLALGINNWVSSPISASPISIQSQQPQFAVAPASRVLAPTDGVVDLTDAAERSLDAVVHVTTETTVAADPFAEFFWGYEPKARQQQGAGSGVVLSHDGYIVTNNHVIAGADKIMIHTNDRKSYSAEVVGADASTDIALLRIKAEDLPFIELGNSDNVAVGEWVLAVGNPFNLTSTVTAGIVSAKARNINLLRYDPDAGQFPLESFIQTDAAVNPGNSGGALVSTSGSLIGINTAIASQTGSYAGYSFAIPVNLVAKVTNDLMEYGSVQRAYIGVNIADMDQELADEVGMTGVRGVYVRGVTEKGAALDAGITEGDVILKVGNQDVNTVPQLQEQIGKFRPGDQVSLTLYREAAATVVQLELRDRSGGKELSKEVKKVATDLFGAKLEKAPNNELDALNLKHGVKVRDITGGKFRASGIKEGFIITSIDKKPMANPESVKELVESSEGGVLVEGVYPNGTKAYYGLGS